MSTAETFLTSVNKFGQGPTGIPESLQGVKVQVHPNPSSGLIQISSDKILNNIEIELYNVQGKRVYSKHHDFFSNDKLEITGPAGAYYLRINSANGQSIVKLVKQ